MLNSRNPHVHGKRELGTREAVIIDPLEDVIQEKRKGGCPRASTLYGPILRPRSVPCLTRPFASAGTSVINGRISIHDDFLELR